MHFRNRMIDRVRQQRPSYPRRFFPDDSKPDTHPQSAHSASALPRVLLRRMHPAYRLFEFPRRQRRLRASPNHSARAKHNCTSDWALRAYILRRNQESAKRVRAYSSDNSKARFCRPSRRSSRNSPSPDQANAKARRVRAFSARPPTNRRTRPAFSTFTALAGYKRFSLLRSRAG